VDQLELPGRVQWTEAEAAGAADPAREGADRNADPGPRIVDGSRIPWRLPQGSHLRTENPPDLIEQTGLGDHLGSFRAPRLQAPDDDAHGGQIDNRANATGGDEVAWPGLADDSRRGLLRA
jgi:hypothetical protein